MLSYSDRMTLSEIGESFNAVQRVGLSIMITGSPRQKQQNQTSMFCFFTFFLFLSYSWLQGGI